MATAPAPIPHQPLPPMSRPTEAAFAVPSIGRSEMAPPPVPSNQERPPQSNGVDRPAPTATVEAGTPSSAPLVHEGRVGDETMDAAQAAITSEMPPAAAATVVSGDRIESMAEQVMGQPLEEGAMTAESMFLQALDNPRNEDHPIH